MGAVMDRQEFEDLFKASLVEALRRATPEHEPLPSNLRIDLHGAGYGGVTTSVDQAAANLYLGPKTFYRIIDIGVRQADRNQDRARLFVHASGHAPGSWGETWDPAGNGPFKILDPWGYEGTADNRRGRSEKRTSDPGKGCRQFSNPSMSITWRYPRMGVIGRDGQPISRSIQSNPIDAHIPLSEWLTWSEWWRP